ncbi:hypothetical protein [Sporomusa sp. KB1]|jgi:hypothetical protein|uniref:hypothetical protein n=1 Tax=Sporomusa sp. KB1 TaxID=943346 RepID=UPI0011A80271|nr:hypothetical protein [Sporomusa sp. KB1]
MHQLHGVSAYLGFILIAIHLGFHWKEMQEKLCRWLGISYTSFAYVFLSRITALMIIGYGIHASFLRASLRIIWRLWGATLQSRII